MTARTAFWSAMALWLVVITCSACESNEQLGSACRGGVCPRPAAVQGAACLASSYSKQIALDAGRAELCLPNALPTDDEGAPRCEVSWRPPWPDNVPGSPPCNGHDFLTGPEGDGGICVVRHVTEAQRAAGELEGWYHERDESGPCGVAGAIRFTAGVDLSAGEFATVSCGILQARDESGEVVPIELDQCARPPEQVDPSGVGDACMPGIIPARGFDPREAYVETGTPECATGTCLVFQLEGDPSSDCVPSEEGPPCATQAEVDRSAYCSCRCDVPGGAPGDGCECPDGFACQEVLAGGTDDGLRGGYCVSTERIAEP